MKRLYSLRDLRLGYVIPSAERLTLAQVAAECGVSSGVISVVERPADAEKPPSPDVRARLHAFYRTRYQTLSARDVDALIDGKFDPARRQRAS